MAERLYIGEEDYGGLLRTRPQVPINQVWVFHRTNGSPTCVWGMGEEGSRPPRPSWFGSFGMQIYKFQQTATFPWQFQLFETLTFVVEMNVSVTLTLVDPVSYMGFKQFDNAQNQLVKDALLKALQGMLAFEPQRSPLLPQQQAQSDPQVVPLTLRALLPEALGHLLPDGDLGLYLQNHPAIRKLGVRARVIVHETHIPSTYNKIITKSQAKLQEELAETRQRLTPAKRIAQLRVQEELAEIRQRLTPAKRNTWAQVELLAVRERLFTNIGEYYTGARARVEPVLKTLVDRGGGAQEKDVIAAIFKDIVGMQIEELTPAADLDSVGASASTQQTSATSPQEKEDIRNKHIGELYDVINDSKDLKDWMLSPPRDKVDEVILISIGNNCKIELQVPKGYPKDHPVVKARKDTEPIMQREVNDIVQPIISKGAYGYDLTTLVKTVADTINPPIPLSIPTEKDELQQKLPPPQDTDDRPIGATNREKDELQQKLPPPQDTGDGTMRATNRGEEELEQKLSPPEDTNGSAVSASDPEDEAKK